MSLRSPLSRVLGSGSAKDGTEHWWSQRVSAIALLVLGTWFLIALLRMENFAYLSVREWVGHPFNGIMLLSLCVTLAWHSSLGVQVVIEDYVHGPVVKVLSLILNRFAHVLMAIAAVYSILRIALVGVA